MTLAKFTTAAILALSVASAPAFAQAKPAEQIVLVAGNASAPVTVLGQVNAEHHQKSLFSKINPREELDKQLRAAAAKLGADAVINVSYDMNSPVMSKKGQLAKGTAVKFNAAPVAPVQVAVAPAPVAPVTVAPPAVAAPASVVAPPVVAPPVVAVPVAPPAAAPVAAAPVVSGVIALAEGDAPGGRAYGVLGAINASAKPQLDKAPKQLLDEDFRAKAKAMGADAVIMIKYDASGASASGVAVKYK